jgi:hypothetical protein
MSILGIVDRFSRDQLFYNRTILERTVQELFDLHTVHRWLIVTRSTDDVANVEAANFGVECCTRKELNKRISLFQDCEAVLDLTSADFLSVRRRAEVQRYAQLLGLRYMRPPLTVGTLNQQLKGSGQIVFSVIGAGKGVGKTLLTRYIAERLLGSGLSVGVVSVERSPRLLHGSVNPASDYTRFERIPGLDVVHLTKFGEAAPQIASVSPAELRHVWPSNSYVIVDNSGSSYLPVQSRLVFYVQDGSSHAPLDPNIKAAIAASATEHYRICRDVGHLGGITAKGVHTLSTRIGLPTTFPASLVHRACYVLSKNRLSTAGELFTELKARNPSAIIWRDIGVRRPVDLLRAIEATRAVVLTDSGGILRWLREAQPCADVFSIERQVIHFSLDHVLDLLAERDR